MERVGRESEQARMMLEAQAHQALEQQRWAHLQALAEQLLTLEPERTLYLEFLGRAFRGQARLDDAERVLLQALALEPQALAAQLSLGLVYVAMPRAEAAVSLFESLVALRPDWLEAWLNLGIAYKLTGQVSQAFEAYRRAHALAPAHTAALNNIATFQLELGLPTEAVETFCRAVALEPENAYLHSSLVFSLLCDPKASHEQVREHLLRTPQTLVVQPPVPRFSPQHDWQVERRLRIGYLTPNARAQSDFYFLQPLLSLHNHEQFYIHLYADVQRPDAQTQLLASRCDAFTHCYGDSDETLIQKVVADRIDILVELAGHTLGNRLRVLRHRPAPLQLSFHGVGSTGLIEVDARISDEYLAPEQNCPLELDPVLRLPRPAQVYAAPRQLPAVTPPPHRFSGEITFGSFNNMAKLNERVLQVWSEILHAVPRSKLLLKSAGLMYPENRLRVVRFFEQRGIAEERLRIIPFVEQSLGHLALYSGMDIALDPFPYGGCITTWEALWMGVPVVTFAGQGFAGRMGAALMHALGLDSLISSNERRYIEVAVALAQDRSLLEQLRRQLRPHVACSSVADGEGLVRVLEQTYQTLWKERVAKEI
ncbi:MAG: tetratricopeptide repeat protein [Myxococcota bacterium]